MALTLAHRLQLVLEHRQQAFGFSMSPSVLQLEDPQLLLRDALALFSDASVKAGKLPIGRCGVGHGPLP